MSGEFTGVGGKDTDEESGHGDRDSVAASHKQTRKTFSTPTDFSEVETTSSDGMRGGRSRGQLPMHDRRW
nr:unnamed protein product [Callosobruchus chinensis]